MSIQSLSNDKWALVQALICAWFVETDDLTEFNLAVYISGHNLATMAYAVIPTTSLYFFILLPPKSHTVDGKATWNTNCGIFHGWK